MRRLNLEALTSRFWAAALITLAAGCNSPRADPSLDAYLEALRLSKTGQPIAAQLQAVDRCIALNPRAADCLEMRGTLHLQVDHPREAREDFDRSIALSDHPSAHFHRAQAHCALEDYPKALEDLNVAIAGQPWQESFYPQRALVKLAMGEAAGARADLKRHGPPAGFAGAALAFVEGRPADSISLLDGLAAQHSMRADSVEFELPRVLRMLSYTALDQPERVVAEFGPARLEEAIHRPSSGFEYWLKPRNCSNAFLATQAQGPLKQAREIFAASARQRAAVVTVQALLERCTSFAGKIDASSAIPALLDLTRQLGEGLLSENEEHCAYGRLDEMVRADAAGRELFRSHLAPALAASTRAKSHAEQWLGGDARQMLRAIKPSVAEGGAVAAVTVSAVPRVQGLWIDRSTADTFVVEWMPAGPGQESKRPVPEVLQVLDERGIRTATRLAERLECRKSADEQEECLTVGEFRYSGTAIAPFAVAFESSVAIVPIPLKQAPLPRSEQIAHLAALFKTSPIPTTTMPEVFDWAAGPDGGWVERRAWREESRPGWWRVRVEPTGNRFDDCSLGVQGPLTEFTCSVNRGGAMTREHRVYLAQQRIGGHDDPSIGSSLRYAAMLNGMTAYFFLVDWNSVLHVHAAMSEAGRWREQVIASHRAGD